MPLKSFRIFLRFCFFSSSEKIILLSEFFITFFRAEISPSPLPSPARGEGIDGEFPLLLPSLARPASRSEAGDGRG